MDEILKKLSDLETRISDTKKRLPAHSTKPPIMMELLDLEDEYDMLQKKLSHLKNGNQDG